MSIWQYRRRQRNKAVPEWIGTFHDWVGNSEPSGLLSGFLEIETSEVYDENHGIKWRKGTWDDGGNLDIYRTTLKHEPAQLDVYRPVGPPRKGLAYSGKILAADPPTPSINDARGWANYNAPGLWNKARPAQPVFEGLNAFYELKDLKDMLKARTQDLLRKGAGFDVYLAYKFGWAPLLRDLRDFTVAHFALRKALDQARRDEGKSVRRTARLKKDSYQNLVHESPSYGWFGPTFVTQCYASEPNSVLTYDFSTEVWFVGEFKYWLPAKFHSDRWYWTPSVLATMYGFNPTPARVYKAIPWSWLADWFSNVGDIIAASSSNIGERLAADYAYTMCHIKASVERRSWGEFYNTNSFDTSIPVTATCTVTREHKSRVPAGIFGPMVGLNDLSPTQTAIAGAIAGKRL